MSGVSGGHQDVDIDLGGLFRAIWARRLRVLAVDRRLSAGLAFAGAKLDVAATTTAKRAS